MDGRRNASFLRLFLRLQGWGPLVLLAMAAFFALAWLGTSAAAERLEREGRQAVATVTDREVRVRTDSEGRSQRTYVVTVRFTAEDGQEVEGRQNMARSFYDSVRLGSEVPVTYVASDPGTFELVPGATARTSVWMGLVALGLGVGAGLWGRSALRDAASARRALRDGPLREARVTAHLETGVTSSRRRQIRLAWRDAVGQEGRSLRHGEGEIGRWPPGSVIRVYADPQDGRSWWEEDLVPSARGRASRSG